jgi:hypothetical protein
LQFPGRCERLYRPERKFHLLTKRAVQAANHTAAFAFEWALTSSWRTLGNIRSKLK